MGQPAPDDPAIPGAAVGPPGKAQAKILEAADHPVGAALLLEQLEDGAHRPLDFLVGVEHDLVILEHQADRQREMEFTLAALLSLPPWRRADDVESGLGEGAFEAENEAVVEIRRIVRAILVDHDRSGDGTQLEQAVPLLAGACQARGLQGEHRPHLAHRHIVHQGLEVVPGRRARLAQVAVEDPDPLRRPPQLAGPGAQLDIGAPCSPG